MLESIEHQYRKIGYIAQAHGVKGDLLIIPEMYAPTLFDTLDLVRIKDARGDLIPARVESVRVQEKNNRLSFFVKFEHVNDRSQAEKLTKLAVYASRDQVDRLPDQDHQTLDLTSFELFSDDKRIGSVNKTIQNPAHSILQVRTDEGDQLLIPFVDEYITAVDEKRQRLQCQNLDQLKGR